jgi:hypothetical protein
MPWRKSPSSQLHGYAEHQYNVPLLYHPELNMASLRIPAQYRYSPFFDCLADALFLHRHAVASADRYTQNRYARAAVVAAALSVECFANCLIAELELIKSEFDNVDKLNPLDKIARYCKDRKISGFSKGTAVAQCCRELIEIRNRQVHPKTIRMPVDVLGFRDRGKEWELPFEIDLDLSERLGIPDGAFAWGASTSSIALKAAFQFHDSILRNILSTGTTDFAVLLATRVEFKGGLKMIMPVFDEIKLELAEVEAFGLSIDGLGLASFLQIVSLPGEG